MNKTFSFKRYALLLKCQWYENVALYIKGIVITAALIALFLGLNLSIPHSAEYSRFENIQTFVLFIVGTILLFAFGASFFKKFNSKQKGMFHFSLPVLPLERIAVAFTYVAILAPILFLMIFNVLDFIVVQSFNHIHGASEQMLFNAKQSIFIVFITFLSFSSISALGSLMFGKKGAVISVLFIVVSTIVYVLIYSWLIEKGILPDPPKREITIGGGNEIFVYLIPIWWILMYFVMKRKEIK